MINLTELEVTRRLYPEYLTDPNEWQEAMARLKLVHFKATTGNPMVAMATVKVTRNRLGLASTKQEVSKNALHTYGYCLQGTRRSLYQGLSKGYESTQG